MQLHEYCVFRAAARPDRGFAGTARWSQGIARVLARLVICTIPVLIATGQAGAQAPMQPSAAVPRAKSSPLGQAPAAQEMPPPLPKSSSGTSYRVAAVVNDEPITMADLLSREQLVNFAAGAPESEEFKARLRTQALRGLIDEALQRQEAKREDIQASDEEVKRGISSIAQQNRMSLPQMEELFQRNQVPLSTVQAQVRAAIVWSKLVQRSLRPFVDISEEDVDAALRLRQQAIGKPEYLVSEIFLAVERPDQEDEVKALAVDLAQQLAAGARFPQLARQFSQSATAAAGGDIGWVLHEQLPPEIEAAVSSMSVGGLSAPVRAATGWYILALRDRRQADLGGGDSVEVTLRQVVLPLPPPRDPFQMLEQAKRVDQLRQQLRSCSDADERAKALGASVSEPRRGRLSSLSPELARLLSNLDVGQATAPVRSAEGVNIFLLCDRFVVGDVTLNRDDVGNALLAERLDLLARRLLRDLRRTANIDIRI